jgi:hypothetical protein
METKKICHVRGGFDTTRCLVIIYRYVILMQLSNNRHFLEPMAALSLHPMGGSGESNRHGLHIFLLPTVLKNEHTFYNWTLILLQHTM